jgi:hypothetical protein
MTLTAYTGSEFSEIRCKLNHLINQVAALKLYDYRAVDEFIEFMICLNIPEMEHVAALLFDYSYVKLIITVNSELRKTREGFMHELANEFTPQMYCYKELLLYKNDDDVLSELTDIWKRSGACVVDGRFIASKYHKVWKALSRFDCQHAPWDIYDWFSVIEMDDDEAASLGLSLKYAVPNQKDMKFTDIIFFFDVIPHPKFSTVSDPLEEFETKRIDIEDMKKAILVGYATRLVREADGRFQPKQLTELEALLQRASELPGPGNDQIYKTAGAVAVASGNIENAILYYQYALDLNAKIGVKTKLQKLKKALG